MFKRITKAKRNQEKTAEHSGRAPTNDDSAAQNDGFTYNLNSKFANNILLLVVKPTEENTETPS